MDIQEYSRAAAGTAVYPHRHGLREDNPIGLAYAVTGLAGEAGEVAQLFAKFLRDGDPADPKAKADLRFAMRQELGDVFWLLNAVADECDLSLNEIAAHNLEKLAGRVARGTIRGSGDNR